jgi:prephenate dehydrogenase
LVSASILRLRQSAVRQALNDVCEESENSMTTSQGRNAILLIGGRGEFGQFLQRDILPSLGAENILTLERDTPDDQRVVTLRQARHIVLSTPLAGYDQQAGELVEQCVGLSHRITIWLISSVQQQVWRAVQSRFATAVNPNLAAVFVHPMYGPNGFRAKEREAGTFQNILTATLDGVDHRVADEVTEISEAFQRELSIGTTSAFDPAAHDQATAYSQGLSYCVAQLMFERAGIDALVFERAADLHRSFHANRNLIRDFLRLNAYTPEVIKLFTDAWQRTAQTTYANVLQAFREADSSLHKGAPSLIPTKWYEKLRAAAAPQVGRPDS